MFIKRVTKTNGRTKKKYSYLHLVESVRTELGPRHRLVLNLGDLNIDKSQWMTLARRIEDILVGRRSLFEVDKNIEQHARAAANKIFEKRAEEVNDKTEDDFQMVNTKSLDVSRPRSLGPEYHYSDTLPSRIFSEEIIQSLGSTEKGRISIQNPAKMTACGASGVCSFLNGHPYHRGTAR